ncbi:exosortase Y-associated Wzy-like protein [Mucilaginibacter calamicampi]|uniref:Exosortase Y-associated Wzy-like protein n=1 Tax=Mucilaginibacter calamicampi TaxID=1302352 RepID=A0ABW2YTD6_9SPHI
MNKSFGKYALLYLPWLASLVVQNNPAASYLIAWLGTFFLFYLCYSGKIKKLPDDRRIGEQIMRPVYLVQIIFIGYMASTSIFYFIQLLGYGDQSFMIRSPAELEQKILLAAQCQRYYVLGHAAFLTGLLYTMKYPVKPEYTYDKSKLTAVLFQIAVICLPLSVISYRIPGLSQFYFQLTSLSFIAGTLALAFAIPERRRVSILICCGMYLINFYQALTSGYKEPIIVSLLVLGIFLYPNYKKIVIAIFVPLFFLLAIYLPKYNQIFRQSAWGNDVTSEEAYESALDATLATDAEYSNWGFLVYRLSEIDMFTQFVKSTPEYIDYYKFDLVGQALEVTVPRLFWPQKPITETMVMERVYNADVVNRGSTVSAKPAFIVDAYLSGGALGVFIGLFIYGAGIQLISQKAEHLFGGYILGVALIFSGLFQIVWRGLSFEFMSNSVLWSYLTMLIIHKAMVKTFFLRRIY